MEGTDEVSACLEAFVDDLAALVDAHRLEALLRGHDTTTEAELGSKPEPWTRTHLVRPLLDAVGLDWEPEIHGKGEGYPDFGITNLDVPAIGEDKSINKVSEASEDVQDYLNNRAASRGAEYGIATDGIEWFVYRIELGGDYLDYSNVARVDFRDALLQIAREENHVSQSDEEAVDVEAVVTEFVETFRRDDFDRLLTREAPKRIRAEKKRGIEEFYDLYVELLFGEGSGDYDYDTTLLDDVQPPEGTSETDERKFAIKLVNRLLFVKFLEDREVLPEAFLTERVSSYRRARAEVDELGGGLYKSQLEPLFFSLFNTEPDDRMSKHRGSWFDDVPYLNGSLFAPQDREREYDVDDRMLETVVEDLVEGHQLEGKRNGDGGLDPSVLGNVFEMTINHVSGEWDAQKDEGAYYTPSDVIKLINRESVDPKIHEILLDVYGRRIADGPDLSGADARALVGEYELGELLRRIEQREGYFSDPAAIQEAYERLGDLNVIDPACGSGHFLTGVLDELHRVRMSLLRGLKGGDLRAEDVYEAKKDLALNAIYGVDVNPIAVEIAKLRVWLKMVEEGWERTYGELPNIDVNIVAGNSLVGLPARSRGQSVLQAYDVDLSAIQSVRDEYRDGSISRRELDARIDELRPELRETYLNRINHYFEDRIETESEWTETVAGLEQRYPTIRTVTVRRDDGEEFSDDQSDRLESAGFSVEPRYGKSAKVEGESVDEVDTAGLLDDGLVFDVERQPVERDLQQLEALRHRQGRLALAYEPFHWPVAFPEAVSYEGNGYDLEFDVVVGNPPYGDVLDDVEKRFTTGYATGSVNDIVGPFLEREVHLLADDGYLGNILALLFAYQSNAAPIRDVIRSNLAGAKVACFTRRPSQVFEGSQARTGVITARRTASGDSQPIRTSRFIRFTDDEREDAFRSVSYESTEGLTLGETIGSGEDYSLPKVGDPEVRRVLTKLKANSGTVIRDVSSRASDDRTEHVVWRSRHPAYFVNPCLENLYPEGETPQDFDPLYFESELQRRAAFLLLQSSLFYLFWVVYENERDVNWKSIDAFPLPDERALEENRERIESLSRELWTAMTDRFEGGSREMIDAAGALKPIADEVDDLFGPLYGLTDEEVEFVKRYDEQHRLSGVAEEQLIDLDME